MESGYTASVETKCYKVGNLCTLSFIISGNMNHYRQIATGLPIPMGSNKILNFAMNVNIINEGDYSGLGCIDETGALKIRQFGHTVGTGSCCGSVTYACE